MTTPCMCTQDCAAINAIGFGGSLLLAFPTHPMPTILRSARSCRTLYCVGRDPITMRDRVKTPVAGNAVSLSGTIMGGYVHDESA